MAKVTIYITPEEDNEGSYGHTIIMTKDNVVLLDDLVQFYEDAAKGAGWVFKNLEVYND